MVWINEKIAEGLIGYGENADNEQADEDFSTELGAEISGLMESRYGDGLEEDDSGIYGNGPGDRFSDREPYAFEDNGDLQDTKDLTRISANVRDIIRREQTAKIRETETAAWDRKPEVAVKDRWQDEGRDSVPKMGLIREPDFVEDDAQESSSSGQARQTYSKAYLDRVFEEELKKSRERRMQTGTDSGNNWMIYG